MKQIYAGIGSRETPGEVLECMRHVGTSMANAGWTLRSGRAKGADKAFEDGARYARGKCEIFLPEPDMSFSTRSLPPSPPEIRYLDEVEGSVLACKLIARLVHPKGKSLSPQALELHARNTYQILGKDLNTPCDVVLCYTQGAQGGGGTGQAIRLAKLLNIRIIDFGMYDNVIKWRELTTYILSSYAGRPY